MIIASHAIFSCYGFWLPNDPRGSWSDFVGKWELYVAAGKATKTDSKESVAGTAHDTAARINAKKHLKFPPVLFSEKEISTVASGFEKAVSEKSYNIHACSIMPDHIHCVIGRHEKEITGIVAHLKIRATQALRSELNWPAERPVWSEGSWKAFLDSPEAIKAAIDYVNENPIKDGRNRQKWPFIKPFEFY